MIHPTIDQLRDMYRGKIVTFNKRIEEMEAYPEAHMKARIVDLTEEHDGEVIRVLFSYAEHEDHNAQFESCNYYDQQGEPTLNARQAGCYEQVEAIYMDGEDRDWSEMLTLEDPDAKLLRLTGKQVKILADLLRTTDTSQWPDEDSEILYGLYAILEH